MRNIHDLTETATCFPGYISIDDNEGGRLAVSVRTRGAKTAGVIEMNRDQLQAMHADIGAYLDETAPAPVAENKQKVKPEPKSAKEEKE